MKNLLVVFIIFGCLGCLKKENAIIITGKAENYNNQKIYLKSLDPFMHNFEAAILDSTQSGENGEFMFSIPYQDHNILTLSIDDKRPPINRFLNDIPDKFGSSFCGNFILAEPSFYTASSCNIEINWKVLPKTDEFRFINEFSDSNRFVSFYEENGNGVLPILGKAAKADQITNSDGYKLTEEYIAEKLKEFKIRSTEDTSIDNYLYTELVLGSYNNFIIWSHNSSEEFLPYYERGEIPHHFEGIIEEFKSMKWNSISTECYKMCENIVTILLNKQNKKFAPYYPPSQQKIEIAKSILPEDLASKYIENLQKVIE